MGQVTTKVCSRCGRELPLGEFYKNVQEKDGYKYECKECCKRYYKPKNFCRIKNDLKPIFKMCGHCKKIKPISSFWINNASPDGLTTICKDCGKDKNKERVKHYCKIKYQNNINVYFKGCSRCGVVKPIEYFSDHHSYCKECACKYAKDYKNNNRDLVKKRASARQREQSNFLEDRYVKGQLGRMKSHNRVVYFKSETLPKELIDLKRTIILIKRELKNAEVNA